MHRILQSITRLNPLSRTILRTGTSISLLMLLISLLLTYLRDHTSVLNTLLVSCARVYPLLTLMVLTITVVGSFLIDIYANNHGDP